MGVLTLLIAALAIWLIWTGKLQRMTAKDGIALGAALVGAVLAAKGKPVIGAPLLISVALFFAQQGQARARRRKRAIPPDKGGTEALAAQINVARDLLLQERAGR